MLCRIFLLFLITCSVNCFAQKSIGIDPSPSSYVFPDTSNYGMTAVCKVTLLNTGSLPIANSSITVFTSTKDSLGTMTLFHAESFTVTLLNNGDTISVNFYDTIKTSTFKSGINTVVIWPVASDTTIHTKDSLALIVFIDTMSYGTNFLSYKNSFMMYPNPATDVLYFKTFSAAHPYKKINIYDLNGKKNLTSDFTDHLDISSLSRGMHIISLETEAGEQKKMKFFKE